WMSWSGWPEYDNVNFIRATLTTSTTSPPSPASQSGTISNLSVTSGKNYQQFSLASGSGMYTDRAYAFGTVPGTLSGQIGIRTANDDKVISSSSPLISFTVNQDSMVYILYTNVNSTIDATWLTSPNGWTLDSFTVPSTLNGAEANRLVKHKFFGR